MKFCLLNFVEKLILRFPTEKANTVRIILDDGQQPILRIKQDTLIMAIESLLTNKEPL